MATDPQPPPATPPPTVHEAELAPGPSGAVEYGSAITVEEAVRRRQQGLDIVVRGVDEKANRRLAGSIEAGAGPPSRPQPPHTNTAGPHALPHFHQRSRTPAGHSFYETKNRKARKKP